MMDPYTSLVVYATFRRSAGAPDSPASEARRGIGHYGVYSA